MKPGLATPPGGSSRRSFYLFLLLVPAGLIVILAVFLIVQFKQFRGMVSPTAAPVPEVIWNDSSQAKLDNLEADLRAFVTRDTARLRTDSLWMSAQDLNLLLFSSAIALSQNIRLHVDIVDTLIIVETTQPIQAMQGRLAWIFRKMDVSGYLNARLEGYPELNNGRLTFFPVRGFINDRSIPVAVLTARGGLSPGDLMNQHEFYDEFVRSLHQIKVTQGKILLVRNGF